MVAVSSKLVLARSLIVLIRLSMAATEKNDTIESLVKKISELTNTNSALTVTIKKLANQLERAQSKNRQSENNGASSGGK